MNTVVITLPSRRPLAWDRIRGLYNGVGYVIAVTWVIIVWESVEYSLPQILAGQAWDFVRNFAANLWVYLLGTLPGPTLIPVVVNLAPRTGMRRLPWLLAAAIPMSVGCVLSNHIHLGWDVRSLGFMLDALSTTGLVVGVCAYHTYSRTAADALARAQIDRTGLDAELRRARLQLLRAQIEPHFLFNTLSVVRALARSDRPATVEMLGNLMRYFQAALPCMRASEAPLRQEMDLVRAYLAIYRARMGRRLVYEVDLPADLAEVPIPTMMLLTLVENALKHGIGPTVEGGIVRVSAVCEGGSLLLKVADSGQGLDVRHGHGAGLANISQRLLMMYGPDAMLSLRPAEPRGVVATICLPRR
ncbi:MAG TPA: histidine kinase [Steroidobacteraceae bacterium]|nr:histidine kinase [Steroidobacteraceae bacterium]